MVPYLVLILSILIFKASACGKPCTENSAMCCTNGCGCMETTDADLATNCDRGFADCSTTFCGGIAATTCAQNYFCIYPEGSTAGDCVQAGDQCTCPNPPITACKGMCAECPSDPWITYGCCGDCQYELTADEKNNPILQCVAAMTDDSICPEINCGTCETPGYFDGCNTCQCNHDTLTETCGVHVCDTAGVPSCINEGDSCDTCTQMMLCPEKMCLNQRDCGGCCGDCKYSFNDNKELECVEVTNVCLEDSCEAETMEYNECVSACGLATCEGNLNICYAMCVPGCKCKDGYPYYDETQGKCITEQECPITEEINCATCGTPRYSDGCNTCICNDDGTESCDTGICKWEGIPECLLCPEVMCADPCKDENAVDKCVDGGVCMTTTVIGDDGCNGCPVFEYCDKDTTTTPTEVTDDGNDCEWKVDWIPFGWIQKDERKSCRFCKKHEEECEIIIDHLNDLYDVKDCFYEYCKTQIISDVTNLECDEDRIDLRADWKDKDCGCGMFECVDTVGSSGGNQFGVMIGTGFVMFMLSWM